MALRVMSDVPRGKRRSPKYRVREKKKATTEGFHLQPI
jgi:hypothetical protein